MRNTSKRRRRSPGRAGFWVLVLALVFLDGACGKDGGGGGGANPEPSPTPEPTPDPLGLHTAVGLNTMSYGLKGLTACLNRDSSLGLPTLAGSLVVDGDLGAWANIPGLLDDPVGDATATLDLVYVGAAASGEDLALAMSAIGSSADVYVEIGGLTAKDGALSAVIRRLLRVKAGVLEDFTGGAFHAVGAELGVASLTPIGGEILLSRRLLGDAVTHPLWWIRVFTRDSAGVQDGDSTAAQYFPSMLGTDDPPFVLATCLEWMGRKLPVNLVQIRDARGGDANTPLEQTAERAYELTRMAFDVTVDLLGLNAMPVTRMAALATFRPVNELVDATGFGLEKDPVAAGYRGLLFDARDLSPNAVESFPQGLVVQRVVGKLIEVVLRRDFPAADDAFVNAWREALLDHGVRRFLGTSYWLDTYADRLESVRGLSPLAAGGDVTDAGALGFGRLLAQALEPQALMETWREANAAGGDPAAALKAAARAHAGDETQAAALMTLWPGWVEVGPFEPLFAPDALNDTDLDGLPDHFERRLGTLSDRADTDNDGWTDFSELVAESDPTVNGKTPSIIMPDGDFGDWQQLLPKRLGVDRGKSGLCPKAADINFYAAIATRDDIVIGAVAGEYWENEPKSKWEVEFDLTKSNEQRLVTGIGGSREYVVKEALPPNAVIRRYHRAMPVARRTIEWGITRQALGLETYFDTPDTVRLRLRTVYSENDQEIVCDETDWFVPSISGTPE